MNVPIVCTLTAEQLRQRRDALLPGLAERADHIELLDNGARLQFTATPTLLHDIVAVVDAERQCCQFLTFELAIAANGGPITLTISAPPAAMPVVVALVSAR